VLGVLGQVGNTDAGFCSSGLSFADSTANTRVARLLAKECARVGGCGPSHVIDDSAGGAAGAENDGADDAGPGRSNGGAAGIASLYGGAPGDLVVEVLPSSSCELRPRPVSSKQQWFWTSLLGLAFFCHRLRVRGR
jgi:hypothetical protein